MDNEEYQMTQDHLALFADMMLQLDLAAFISAAERAETLGPVLDPTLYRKASGRLGKIIALARAGVAFQQAARALNEEAARPV